MLSIQKYYEDISKAPAAKQAAVGGASGWVVGYLSMKVGKMAATAVGGSLIIIQLAVHNGYIKVDWRRVNKDLEFNTKKLTKEIESRVNPGYADEKLQKLNRKIDRTINHLEGKAESYLEKKLRSSQKMWQKYVLGNGESKLTLDDIYALNMYVLAFSAGAMLGVATARVI